MFENERWKDVAGYEGMYRVSDHGRVQSLDRLVPHGMHGVMRRIKGVMLQGDSGPDGRMWIILHKDGKQKCAKVHALVCAAFNGPKPGPEFQCCHWDGNAANNHFSNLRWGTGNDNRLDAARHGTIPKGDKHTASKLKESQIPKIRELYKSGITQPTIAAMFGVTQTCISAAVRGKCWKHVL